MDPLLLAAVDGIAPWDLADIVACRELSGELESQLTAGDVPGLEPDQIEVTEEALGTESGQRGVRVRVYRPRSGSPDDLRGALVLFHGGAFCLGDLETEHVRCLLYAQLAGIVVVSVEYRLAPEHPYPAGVSDCYAGLVWAADHAADLGIDAGRIAVGGISAGGALAGAVALMARDRSGPSVVAQMLLFPVTNSGLDTTSMRRGDQALAWQSGPNRQMWELYLGTAHPAVDGYAAPLLAESCASLPPAFLAVADQDPLRDEALLYGMKLLEADVVVELHLYAETYHVFDLAAPAAAVSQQALADQVRFLTTRLSGVDRRG